MIKHPNNYMMWFTPTFMQNQGKDKKYSEKAPNEGITLKNNTTYS